MIYHPKNRIVQFRMRPKREVRRLALKPGKAGTGLYFFSMNYFIHSNFCTEIVSVFFFLTGSKEK